MCDFNTLSSNDNGFILQCCQCGHYQLGFAGVLLSLDAADYQKFGQLIQHIYQKEVPQDKLCSRPIIIPTPHYGVNLLLTKDEINVLHKLIGAADNEEAARNMLALFSCN